MVTEFSGESQPDNPSSVDPPFDREMMQRCLQLARRALGKTAPNPMVGAVVVREEEIVGEGFHPGVGQPHAEVFALRQAGELAAGATVYVSLEPCNHYGRTPPCTEALIAARVAKVVIGMVDPDPRVSGGGIERLQRAGIETIVGVEEADCRQLNEAFIHRVLHRRSFGILKYAMTLDGKIATAQGHSAWVTGDKARHYVHQLRAACDAVIVGSNTVRLDNPYLTSHQEGVRNPLRVVMSRSLELPTESHLWQTEEAPTLVITQPNTNPELRQRLAQKGVDVIELTPLTPTAVMQYLYKQQYNSVLWECGGTLAARAIAEGAVQKITAFIAPKIIGGQTAPSPVGELGLGRMTEALNLERITWKTVETDFLVEGYLPDDFWQEQWEKIGTIESTRSK